MRSILVSSVLIAAGIALAAGTAEQKPRQKSEPPEGVRQPQTVASDQSQDEKLIRQTAEEVVRVYNAADAKALAALFTSDAEIVDHHGNAAQGRETIEQEFAEVFADNPGGKIEIAVDSVRCRQFPDTEAE